MGRMPDYCKLSRVPLHTSFLGSLSRADWVVLYSPPLKILSRSLILDEFSKLNPGMKLELVVFTEVTK
jgi:hypothetical protein